MVIYINTDLISLDFSSCIFRCKYMSSDNHLGSIWNYIRISCDCLSFCNRCSRCRNFRCFIAANLARTIICNLEIFKFLSIHVLCCIGLFNSAACKRIIIFQDTCCPYCIFGIDFSFDNSEFRTCSLYRPAISCIHDHIHTLL